LLRNRYKDKFPVILWPPTELIEKKNQQVLKNFAILKKKRETMNLFLKGTIKPKGKKKII